MIKNYTQFVNESKKEFRDVKSLFNDIEHIARNAVNQLTREYLNFDPIENKYKFDISIMKRDESRIKKDPNNDLDVVGTIKNSLQNHLPKNIFKYLDMRVDYTSKNSYLHIKVDPKYFNNPWLDDFLKYTKKSFDKVRSEKIVSIDYENDDYGYLIKFGFKTRISSFDVKYKEYFIHNNGSLSKGHDRGEHAFMELNSNPKKAVEEFFNFVFNGVGMYPYQKNEFNSLAHETERYVKEKYWDDRKEIVKFPRI